MVVAVDLEAPAAAEGDDDALPPGLGDPRVRNVLARNKATAHRGALAWSQCVHLDLGARHRGGRAAPRRGREGTVRWR